jgi:hypothetical protein
VRNIPPDPDESISELVEHFFLVNHPDHYLRHQVIFGKNLWITKSDVVLLLFSSGGFNRSSSA